ncbi:GlxA family transcriptional regulator [Streptomyces boninensis]|uniref:GlxA family transcriptional regulator n=1 Tax=Streptomyces boninensis TaxID=2039455 RepID=UPI003B227E43
MSIRVAVALLDPTSLFEFSIPCHVFGGPGGGGGTDPGTDYELVIAGTAPSGDAHRGPAGLALTTVHGLEALRTADTIVIPAGMYGEYVPPPDLLDELRAAHANGARIASLCTGAYVLAAAGLLDGRTAATHWQYAEGLRRDYPRVRVDDRSLYRDDGDILTSAGTAAGIDLCLHIVRTDFGSAAAAEVGRRMVVAPHREGDQTQYAQPARPLPTRAQGLGPVLDWAEARLHEPLTIAELAGRAGMSLRTFGRRFAEEVGTTPLRWLNQQRVARARELLETTDLTVDAIADRSGLGTADGLRQHFHRAVGTTPAAYRRTFRGAA